MASTRLVRKALRNRTVAKRRVSTIKRLTSKPVIKNVDIEQIKEEFAKKKATPAAKKEVPVKEAPKAVEKTVEAPKQEKAPKAKATPKAEATVEVEKAAPKKAAAKKTAPKAKKEAAPKAKKEDKASE
jgi:hypothetical protein